MRRRSYVECERCEQEKYGDDFLFNLNFLGLGWVCEDCFLYYAEHEDFCDEDDFEEYGWSGELLANALGIEFCTAESYIEDEYSIALEEAEEARRDMYL